MHDPADALLGGGLHHHFGAGRIDAREVGFVAGPQLGDAGEMIDLLDLLAWPIVETLRIEDRAAHEFDVGRQVVGFGEVEHADAIATRAQCGNQMPPDETAAARDQNRRHRISPRRHGTFCGCGDANSSYMNQTRNSAAT